MPGDSDFKRGKIARASRTKEKESLTDMRWLKLLLPLCVLAVAGIVLEYGRLSGEEAALRLDVKAAVLMDMSTGNILYEQEADRLLPPASMSKMMTEYLVLEAVKSRKVRWQDDVKISRYAAGTGGSGIQLKAGERMKLRELFSAMVIHSANDAAAALAEHLSGTEERFAERMNIKAKSMGLSAKAHFLNATGLPRSLMGDRPSPDAAEESVMTARDAALLAKRLIKDFPEVLEVASRPSFKSEGRGQDVYYSTNMMLDGRGAPELVYEGLDGLKTGFTDEAGYCFTGTAKRGDVRLISVVMGAGSETKRFEETRKLLDFGFRAYGVS